MSRRSPHSVTRRTGLLLLLLAQCHGAAAGDFVQDSGGVVRTMLPVVAWGTTIYLHDTAGQWDFYQSFAANYVATNSLKALISKTRPDGSDDDSFPSGHTSTAFQSAAFIHFRYGIRRAVPAYLAATYVGWTRWESDRHFLIDVMAGAALGIASSYVFTDPRDDIAVTPLVDAGFYGVRISKRW